MTPEIAARSHRKEQARHQCPIELKYPTLCGACNQWLTPTTWCPICELNYCLECWMLHSEEHYVT